MSSAQLYDTIGATYTVTRRTEPRITAQVWAALGDAQTVLNVGAGTGSYEPPGLDVTAVEPSGSGRTPSSGQCAASVMTAHPAGGPNATATSSISTRQSLAIVCLSPELATSHRRWDSLSPKATSSDRRV